MTTHSLDDFFREKRAHAGPANIDWEQRKREWIAAIEQLYGEVESLLDEPVRSGSA